MQRDRNEMRRWAIMPESDMAPFLTNDFIAKTFQRTDETMGRNPSRHLHAASTGISSSFT